MQAKISGKGRKKMTTEFMVDVMVYMHHLSSQRRKLLDPTAVAENRIAGGVGEGTGAIPFPRPDPGFSWT